MRTLPRVVYVYRGERKFINKEQAPAQTLQDESEPVFDAERGL